MQQSIIPEIAPRICRFWTSCFCRLVEREKLAALEFIMSKQPRVLVGIDMHSYGGQRTENVFATTDKFLRKCAEREKLKRSNLQVSLLTNSQHVISFVFLPLDWVHIISLLGNVKHTVVLQFLLLSVTTGLSPPLWFRGCWHKAMALHSHKYGLTLFIPPPEWVLH